ncbi:MAG TPA: tetratricopeptide repeat protein [Terriglobales bacterium]|nr:tetratricopeptide repeat protein [Terriglobales bacterium]
MNKKATEHIKDSGSKASKTKGLRASMTPTDSRNRGNGPMKVSEDPRFTQAVQNYESGLKALQAHKYDKAKAYFEKVAAGSSPELADRALVHLATCNQQMSRASTTFKTAEEQFDYAVSLMNMGDYVTARENFDSLTAKYPKLDFIWYGVAALNCLTGRFPEAISNLGEAIRLNPSNRYQARNDSDFRNLADDPRFTELLYPDISAEAPSDTPKWRY